MIDVRVVEHGRIKIYTIHNSQDLIQRKDGTWEIVSAEEAKRRIHEDGLRENSFVLIEQGDLARAIMFCVGLAMYFTAFVMMCLK